MAKLTAEAKPDRYPTMPLRRAVLVPMLALILTACAGLGDHDGADLQPRAVPVDAARAEQLVNAYRARFGLPPLAVDPALNRAAQEMADIIARRGNLGTPEHSSRRLARRLDRLGYDNLAAAENIGGGYRDLDHVMDGWKNSSDHDKNLKNKYVTRFGIARADSSGGTWTSYWAMILALPRDDYRAQAGNGPRYTVTFGSD